MKIISKSVVSLFLCLAVAVSVNCLGISVSAGTTTTYKFTEIQNDVNLCGRGAFTADGFYCDISASGLEFALNCSGDVILNLTWKNAVGMIGVIIDGEYDKINKIKIDFTDNKDVTIAQNLSNGIHTFKIIKLSTFSTNQMTLCSVTCDGTLAPKPQTKKLKIELYGDSISCGVGALCPSIVSLSPNGYYDDASSSFGLDCANVLDADISVVAAPGYGYAYGYSTGESQTLFDIYDRAVLNDSSKKWDFSQYKADIVIFELGTNDINYTKNKSLIIDTEYLREKVYRYIDAVRKYNPTCKIVLMGNTGIGDFTNGDKYNGPLLLLDRVLLDATDAYENVYYTYSIGVAGSGGGWHPNTLQAQKIGEILAQYINDHILQPVLYGDANDDGKINIKDLLTIKKRMVKIEVAINEKTANVNLDEKINSKDMLLIKKFIVGMKVTLGRVVL